LTEASVGVVKTFAVVSSDQADALSAIAAFVVHAIVNF